MESAPTPHEESAWITRCRAGDPDAFEPLVRKFSARIQRLVGGILGEWRGDAEDAVQEIFLKAYLALPKFRGDAQFSTWLYRIAVNHCWDIIRRSPPPPLPLDENLLAAERRLTGDGPLAGALPLVVEEEPEDDGEERARQSAETLRRLLGELKERHRTILVMRELEEMSYDEIGQALNIPPGTVRSRLNRARASLLRVSEKYGRTGS